jgi:hypothetical protein
MSVIQVGLVDKTSKLDKQLVQSVAAALNIQVIRDLPQFWNVKATVIYLPDPKKIPAGVWPVNLVAELPPGEGGVHLDKHNQPYSLVIATPESDEWTIDASHETLEMLVDPQGSRLQSSPAIGIVGNKIQDATGQFNYLVEACDPCEADQYAYSVQGVAVSDFITPHFYDPVATSGTRYSFTGAVTAPRQVLPGGYISFIDLETDEWEQILWVNPNQPPTLNKLGPATSGQSLRVWVDSEVAKYRKKTKFERLLNTPLMQKCRTHRAKLDIIATKRARQYT